MNKRVKDFIFLAGLGAVLGGLAGLGLSFTTLSPLVMGGIIGSMLPVLPAVVFIGTSAFISFLGDKDKDEDFDPIMFTMYFGTLTALGVGIGVGLAAAATAIFPGAMLGMLPAALTGAAIGAIAPIVAGLTMDYIIKPIAEKVKEYITSSTAEHAFSNEKWCL
ncbi:hypothetical protein [Wolbachia endosymbiont of Oedothorax gibbosus]|uniref:hypothetical protein n=1 Tax=Wolbachia endosymbiont of Oedothorax gibbosus TaxID=931100 RepID=UPI002024F7D8|nr:hypothetical protein [Wolbachia endosymbiont of Oedothorax gibbosus]